MSSTSSSEMYVFLRAILDPTLGFHYSLEEKTNRSVMMVGISFNWIHQLMANYTRHPDGSYTPKQVKTEDYNELNKLPLGLSEDLKKVVGRHYHSTPDSHMSEAIRNLQEAGKNLLEVDQEVRELQIQSDEVIKLMEEARKRCSDLNEAVEKAKRDLFVVALEVGK